MLRSLPISLLRVVRSITALTIALFALALLSFAQADPPNSSQKPTPRPPKTEVSRESKKGETAKDKGEESPSEAAAQAQPANPAVLPEYPTEIVGTVKEIKPFPIEKVRLNEDVPASSVFVELRVLIHKAVPVAGNRDVVVEPGAEVALITRDPITQEWVGKKLTGLVRLQGDTSGQQRFLSKSKLTNKAGTEHTQ